MAVAAITAVAINDMNTVGAATPTAATSTTDGWLISGVTKGDKCVLVVQNTASTGTAATLTVKKGNGLAGVADHELSAAEDKNTAFILDTSRFMDVSGTNKGKITIVPSAAAATLKISVFQFK